MRKGLLHTAKWVLDLAGYQSEIVGLYKVKLLNGRGVKIVYSCLGIGLFSFWTAFIMANETSIKKKLAFLSGGIIAIFFINVARIVLLVIAANKGMKMPFNTDHHTLFNIASYTLIILLILLFGWSEGRDAKVDEKAGTH